MSSLRVLGLVPARGGSRGIPRKNVRPLAGRPLLAYTAEAALASRSLARVVLSTDDPEIAAVGRACGLDVPFTRPSELAADASPTLGVVRHALDALPDGHEYDAVCLLQPTDPFRTTAEIDEAVALFRSSGADTVISVHRVPDKYNPHWVYLRGDDGALRLATGELAPIARRQDLPPAFHRSGSVYVTRRQTILDGSLFGARVVGLETDPDGSVNLDTMDDWELAERMLRERAMKGAS